MTNDIAPKKKSRKQLEFEAQGWKDVAFDRIDRVAELKTQHEGELAEAKAQHERELAVRDRELAECNRELDELRERVARMRGPATARGARVVPIRRAV